MAYTDAQGRLVAASSERAQAFIDLLPRLTAAGRASGTPERTSALVDDRAYQVVVVPVGAAGLGGSVLMAFALDRAPLQELQRLSGLQSVLLLHAPDRLVEHARLDARQRRHRQRRAAGARDGHQFALALGDESMRALYVSLARRRRPTARCGAGCVRSTGSGTPYRRLQLTLLGLTLLGVAVFALGSVLDRQANQRADQGPVGIRAAPWPGRLRSTAVTRTSDDEIGDLAQAFEAMRRGIQDRERQVHRLAFLGSADGAAQP